MNETNKNYDIHGKEYNRYGVLFLILIATFAGALMQTSLGTAIPTLMKAFDIDLNTAQQATTWFLLANGIMVPLSAFLATKVSTKWLHIFAYATLLIGILATALTPENSSSWWIFIIGRVLAAIAVGIMMPLMQIVILNMFAPKERALAMGLSGLVVGMAPAIGPTLSGWILEKDHIIFGLTISNSWRTIFVIPAIVIGIALVLAPFLMKDIIHTKNIKLDYPSLILSVVGFGAFLWGFTNVASHGWSDFARVILPIASGVLLLVIFAFRQLKLPEPFLDIKVFKVKEFTIPTIGLILSTMAMFGVEMMLPTYMQNIHGLSPLNSGLALLPGALMIGLMSPVNGILYNKVGVKKMAFLGFIILGLGTLPFVFLTEATPVSLIVVLYGIRMFAVAMLMMPLTTSAMAALPVEKATHGTAANNTLRQIASSVVVALLTSITQNIINTNTPASSLKEANPMEYADKMLIASMDGFRVAFAVGLSFAVIGLIFAFFLKGNKNTDSEGEK
ncbi:MDR family MFS transporter [Streptococcaceae bacterium ESL0687]|nr:MDR family MFS transporter [Streptococcaceae bacterium ESL0687]